LRSWSRFIEVFETLSQKTLHSMFQRILMQDCQMPLENDETPAEMQSQIKTYLDDNLVNIIGGCCGSQNISN
jgi:methionine synthase I (cobalamin-dependent)